MSFLIGKDFNVPGKDFQMFLEEIEIFRKIFTPVKIQLSHLNILKLNLNLKDGHQDKHFCEFDFQTKKNLNFYFHDDF